MDVAGQASEPVSDSGRKDIGLVVKLSLTIIFVVIFSVSLTALLTYFNFSKSYSEITQARYLVLAGNLKKSIEYSMNVGVDLDALENAQVLVEEVAGKNQDVSLLRIVSPSGQILFDKDTDLNGQQSVHEFQHAQLLEGTTNRLLQTDTLTIVSMPVQNNFGEQAGEVHIGYSSAHTAAYLQKMAWFLLQYAGLSIFIIALLVLVAVYIMTRQFRKRVTLMGSALTNLLHDSGHDPDEITEVGNFENAYLAFHEKSQELFYSFDAARHDLDKLEKESEHV